MSLMIASCGMGPCLFGCSRATASPYSALGLVACGPKGTLDRSQLRHIIKNMDGRC